ncbi:MAG: ATP-binding protein [Saprospiraceae bacterium]|nr:ATP-binding protein [Saprospiraceae bacterium]
MSEALGLPVLRNSERDKAQMLIDKIEEELHLKITKKDDKFFISWNGENEFEASLVATGINKLAQLIYLIMNGSLTKDTILFWDEPESGLNPKYIKIVAQFLKSLANAGCQIFVATHDYLLPYHLSLSVEYADVMKEMKQPVPSMKFFSLYKGENGTKVEEGDTMPSIHHDAIMEGHHYHSEFERELFRKSVNQGA